MGVFVFAAGIAVFSAKVWSTLKRRKKDKRALLLEGIIPGYTPLNEYLCHSLTQPFGAEEKASSHIFQPSAPDNLSSKEKNGDDFFTARIHNLQLAVRSADEFRFWEADYTEASLPDLERWILEYQNMPFPQPPSEIKQRQTLSLLHDAAAYVVKTATGHFPAFDSAAIPPSPPLIPITDRLAREPAEDADRQLLLQIYYQLKK